MSAHRHDLAERVATRGMGWLHDNRHRGAFPAETTTAAVEPDKVHKPLGESALAAGVVLRAAAALRGQQARAARLLEFCWRQIRCGDLLYERQLRHPLMTDPLEVYAQFAAAGLRHEQLDALLAHLTASRSWWAVEVMPNRRLAVANAARLAGLSRPEDWRPLVEATWLGQRPEPWLIDWATAYAVTHTVFHITDWGLRPGCLPEPVVTYLERWMPVWMRVWGEICDWDLLAELLVVDACLPRPQCPPDMWRLLADAQRDDGLVPRDGQPVTDDEQEAFTDHHHTTAVAVMAGALALVRAGDAGPTP
ncbi:DUF6895 family protein [Actinosynnema sp. NPDC053489]|uniref:DUF6895 family protein n=1 Tax=Actinosynnema sp. NPDC053489 TaxID=3363916 RepID=UPI0037C52FB5